MGCIRRVPIVPASKARALAIAKASLEKKADDVLVLSVAKLTSVADYLVLCSAETDRQVRAIAAHVDSTLSVKRVFPLSTEGASTGQWILIDYGDVVAHIFRTDTRQHYALEKLWSDARRVRLPDDMSSAPLASPRPVRKRSTRARQHG